MRIGIILPIAEEDGIDGIPDYPAIRAMAVGAETDGLDSVWVFDHLLFRDDDATTGIHECWTILAQAQVVRGQSRGRYRRLD